MQADTMPAFEGPGALAEIDESSACRFRLDWFSDSKLVIGDKDALANMQGKVQRDGRDG
ncbi:hypothetical protein [Propionivibrio sp.]|uniref:hypothetical protein n=1 Tax=Propionivibrio sp. TaxID=2212460 RepID=UPI0025FD2453|nr:hypothetical protein [Propionivibrio sp.]MBK7357503.1 hypothetical protein [Propionivibrio sp.]